MPVDQLDAGNDPWGSASFPSAPVVEQGSWSKFQPSTRRRLGHESDQTLFDHLYHVKKAKEGGQTGAVLPVGTAVDPVEMATAMEVQETVATEMEIEDASAAQIGAQVGQETAVTQEVDLTESLS